MSNIFKTIRTMAAPEMALSEESIDQCNERAGQHHTHAVALHSRMVRHLKDLGSTPNLPEKEEMKHLESLHKEYQYHVAQADSWSNKAEKAARKA